MKKKKKEKRGEILLPPCRPELVPDLPLSVQFCQHTVAVSVPLALSLSLSLILSLRLSWRKPARQRFGKRYTEPNPVDESATTTITTTPDNYHSITLPALAGIAEKARSVETGRGEESWEDRQTAGEERE